MSNSADMAYPLDQATHGPAPMTSVELQALAHGLRKHYELCDEDGARVLAQVIARVVAAAVAAALEGR